MERGKDIISGFTVQLTDENDKFFFNELPGPFSLCFPVAHRLFIDYAQVIDAIKLYAVNLFSPFFNIAGLGDIDEDEMAWVPFQRPAARLHRFY
jgi:hypothetical protein